MSIGGPRLRRSSLAMCSGFMPELDTVYAEDLFAVRRPDEGVDCSIHSQSFLGFDGILIELVGAPKLDDSLRVKASCRQKIRLPGAPRKSLRM